MPQRALTPLVFPLLLLVLLVQPWDVRAQDQNDDPEALEVGIDAIRPTAPQPGDELRIRGTVSNTGSLPVSDVNVVLRVSPTPLVARYEVREVATGTTQRSGVPLLETSTQISERLDPGDVAEFRIIVDVDQLGLGPAAVHALFVQATGDTDEGQVSARTSVALPWIPAGSDVEPTGLVTLAEVQAPVARAASGAYLSEALAGSMAADGPLQRLVEGVGGAAAQGAPVAWVVDPAVVGAARDMAQGYRVGSGAAALVDAQSASTGQFAEQVATWSQSLTAALSQPSSETYTTAFADVDASALVRNGLSGQVSDAWARSEGIAPSLGLDSDGSIAAPIGGSLSDEAAAQSAAEGISRAELDARSYPPEEALTYTPTGRVSVVAPPSGMTAALPDELLTEALQDYTAGVTDDFETRQRLLADTAMVSLERPGLSRTLVLALDESLPAPAQWYSDTLVELSSVPWVETRTLPQLLAGGAEPALNQDGTGEAATESVRTALPYSDEDLELSADYLAPVPALLDRVEVLSQVVIDAAGYGQRFTDTLLLAQSEHYRSDPEEGRALIISVERSLAQEETKVRSVSNGQVTFAGGSGDIPLTIANDMDRAVRVGVLLRADPEVRLEYTPPGPIDIEPGKRRSIAVPVNVYGSGPLPVTVVLTDSEGRPFTESQTLQIQSTAASTVALAVVIGAGAVLLGLVAWRFVRHRGRDDDDIPPG